MFKPILSFLLLALSALPTLAQSQADTARAAAGCGPELADFDVKTDKKQHPAPQPEAGKSMVFIIEELKTNDLGFTLGGVTTKVGIDGKWVGANKSDSYFFLPVDPGEHRLCSGWQSTLKRYSQLQNALTFTAEAGKTYYFRVLIYAEETDKRIPHLKLEALDPAEAQLRIAVSGLSTSRQKNTVAARD